MKVFLIFCFAFSCLFSAENIASNKLKNWEFDKEVPPIFLLRRASVFIDTEQGVGEKTMEKPMQSKTNSSSKKGKPGPLGPGSSNPHLGGVRSPFQIIPRPSGRGSLCLSLSKELQISEVCQSPPMQEYAFHGKHFFASYCDCDDEAISDIAVLERAMHEAAEASGATILDSTMHVFPPDGLTMVILLSESHASIHTYPEHRSCFVDLFTCGMRCSEKAFDQVLQKYLQPKKSYTRIFIRDQEIYDFSKSY